MTIWRINGFSHGPHSDFALVEAETKEDAIAWLVSEIRADRIETVWGGGEDAELNPSEWSVSEAVRPIQFVLGAGCR